MDRLEELKNKYRAALETIQGEGVRLTHLHVQDNKLFIQGTAPSEAVKNDVWNQIKAADASYGDVTCELTVDSSMPQAQAAAAGSGSSSAGAATTQSTRTYKVQPGDSLSKIAKQFYGNANEYNRIFEANRSQLDNPDHVRAGQELVIPS